MKKDSIGPREVSTATGVSTDTLRHYERLGLLPKPQRSAAGYRRYDPAVVSRVGLIQRALVVGFSLKDLGSVLRRRDTGEPPCRAVRGLVGERLASLERHLEDLTLLRDEMRRVLEDWDARLASTPVGERARLLDMLEGREAFDEPTLRAAESVGLGSKRRAPKRRVHGS